MATRKNTNRRGVTLLAFPEDHKAQVIQTICNATGLSRADAKQAVENLPAKFTALFDDDDFAADLEALGATVEVTRVPPSSESIICATGEQHIRAASARIATAADLIETVKRALEPEQAKYPEYGSLAHAAELLREADTQLDLASFPRDGLPGAIGRATDEQQVRAWRLAELLASLGNGAVDDDGVNRHAVLLAADYARQLADGLDTVNLLKRGEELAAPVEQPAAECEGMQS